MHEMAFSQEIRKPARLIGTAEYLDQGNIPDCKGMKISGIKKITVSVKAGDGPGEMNLWPEPIFFDFIYGIGTSGLSPFEVKLAEKEAGEIVALNLTRDEMPEFFTETFLLFNRIPVDKNEVYLIIQIVEVSDADQREVIKSMSGLAACGDHCCGH